LNWEYSATSLPSSGTIWCTGFEVSGNLLRLDRRQGTVHGNSKSANSKEGKHIPRPRSQKRLSGRLRVIRTFSPYRYIETRTFGVASQPLCLPFKYLSKNRSKSSTELCR
jgi:hypothetical protein